jgi:hypothetical protein
MNNLDREFWKLIAIFTVAISITGFWAFEATYHQTNYQCTLQSPESHGPFGGDFFNATCIGGKTFSNLGAVGNYLCARVGDNVTITTYGGWYPSQVTGDSNC